MGFGFRVGVPGMSVRVSTRGVRTSLGPRAARISVGSGGTRVSSGLGPFYASSSLRGRGGRRTSTHRSRPRSITPSAAQLDRARRQAERAQQEAQRDAAIAELTALREQTTTVHLQSFPLAQPPVIAPPVELGLAWARAEAQAFHLRGVGRLARAERSAAKARAAQDAPEYLAAEQGRLQGVFDALCGEADQWWRSLVANDEEVVCEAVNTAFGDNPAAGCAVGVAGSVMSVVMRQQDLDALPDQAPGLTPSGRPALKKLSKRERTLWWLTSMGSNVIATLKEGFATAPGITAIDLAVLTRLPDSQRLGFVAFGRWTRHAVETTPWREAQDALRFLDIGQDVACSVKTTASGNFSSVLKPLDVSRTDGLQGLLDHVQEETDIPEPNLSDLDVTLRGTGDRPQPAPQQSPYDIRPFADWKTRTAPDVTTPPPATVQQPHPPRPLHAPTALVPGQTVVLPEEAWQSLNVAFTFTGADADLTLLLTDTNSRVAGDEDFVFYNQPTAANGAARLLGKQARPPHTEERAVLHLSGLPSHVQRVIVSINMDVDRGLTCAALTHAALHMDCVTGEAWIFQPPADPAIRAMVIAEIYRHHIQDTPVWKLRPCPTWSA